MKFHFTGYMHQSRDKGGGEGLEIVVVDAFLFFSYICVPLVN